MLTVKISTFYQHNAFLCSVRNSEQES